MRVRSQQWPWFAILVKTGREKTANLLLENAGYECFLPVNRSTRRWSDRTKSVDVPLFPGYLFCRMNPHNRLTVLMTPGVIQIVGVGKTPIPVEEEEIEAIERVQTSGLSAMPWPYMEVGNVAQIVDGPLRVELRAHDRLLLLVDAATLARFPAAVPTAIGLWVAIGILGADSSGLRAADSGTPCL